MIFKWSIQLRFPMFLICVLMVVGLVQAQQQTTEKASDEKLPGGMEVIAKHVQAIGGKELLSKIKTMITKGTMTIPQAGIEGTITICQTAEGKAIMTADIPGLGKQQSGSDGETIWEMSAITGAEILTGERADQTKMQLTINPYLNYDKLFDSIECTGVEEYEGERCYVVEAKSGDQKPVTTYFSVKTGLEKGSRITAISALGEIELETVVGDYKEVNGIKFSHSAVAKLPNGMTQEVAITSVEINPEIEKGTFDLPEEVAKLKK